MSVDHNIYFRQKGVPNLVDEFKQGYSLGQMIKTNRRENERADQANKVKEIFSKNLKPTNNGSVSLDRKTALGDLYKYNPEMAMKMEKQMSLDEERARKADREQRRHKRDQKRKDDELNLKKDALEHKKKVDGKSKNKFAKNNKQFTSRLSNILGVSKELQKLIQDKGTNELFGGHNQQLAQRIDSIAIDAAKLFDPESVARESEVAAFKKMLFEPGAMLMRNDTALGTVRSFEKMMKDRALREAKNSNDPEFTKSISNLFEPELKQKFSKFKLDELKAALEKKKSTLAGY